MTRPAFFYRRSALVVALAVLIGSWLAAFSFTLWRLREDALANGLVAATMHARNFEEHLTQTLQVIDLSASSIDPASARHLKPSDLSLRLTSLLRPAPFLRSLSLVDRDGKVLASSNPGNLGVKVDLNGFYPVTGAEATLLRIGMPWRGRDLKDGVVTTANAPLPADATSFIPVLRRLDSKENALWMIAALNPDYFINHFVQLLPLPEGRVQMLRYDDRLLLSSGLGDAPGAGHLAGEVTEWLRQHEFGQLSQTLPDRFEALTAYRASSRFPVVIATHLDRRHILTQWQAEAQRLSLIVIPILAALTFAAILVWRRQERFERQRAELDNQRRLAASVFDASTDAIILTTPSGEILSTNAAFQNMTGYSADEVQGKNPRLLASGKQDNAFYHDMWHAIIERGHWQGEIINRHKDGHLYTGLLTINAVHDAAGQLQHYVSVTSDITARKRHEAELLAAKERAEAAVMARTTFLATMSHELRTPMNGVLGMTELLLRSELTEKQRRQLDIAKKSAAALLVILNDILDYSKIEAQNLEFSTVAFDPAEIIHSIVSLFTPHAAAKALTLVESLAEPLPQQVIGDPIRFRQIVTNVVSNAVKFTPAGQITVAAWVEPANTDGALNLYVTVTDTGIGIPPEKQTMIFDAFAQADGSHSRSYGGTGLGLAISRRLAEAMGGELSVDSSSGKGSCFTLRLSVHLENGA